MPDSYSNPSYKPPTRPYKWVPDTIPTGGDTPIGFYPTHIVRGSFRNDVPVQDGYNGGTVTITTVGELKSAAGSGNNPILATHRPKADPDNDRPVPEEVFHIKGADFKWECKLSQSSRLSAITLEYALVVDINDPELLNYLDKDDKALLQQYLQNPTGEPPGIDWNKYKFAKITLDDKEYPANDANGKPVELAVTGTSKSTKNHTVKFVNSFVSSAFPITSTLAISNRVGLASLEFYIAKIYIFDAERVNLHEDQLPCSLMEYAYPVRFAFTPSQLMDAQRLPFPSDSDNPNFHLKVFSPEERIAKEHGLAHSINLRFLVFSMPIFDPLGIFSLYFAIFVGPAPGRRTVKMALSGQLASSRIANANKNRVVQTDVVSVEKDTKTLRLEKVASTKEIVPPSDNAGWQRIDNSTYNIDGSNTFDKAGPYTSEYLFVDNSTSQYDWYRVAQSLRNGGERYSSPIKNQTYSEYVVFRGLSSATTSTKKDTIIRRPILKTDYIGDDPLTAARPIATFVMDGFENLTSNTKIRRGAFKFAIRAKVDDPDDLLTTHLFARFWFVPADSDLNVENLYLHRPSTEYKFQSTATGNKLVKGSPDNLQECIVSPPIPDSLTYLEMTRYNDESVALDTGLSSFKMVVAIYAVAYPTQDGEAKGVTKNTINLPKITLEIDPQYATFDTPIQYVQSDVLFPQRGERYNSSNFTALPQPLVVTKNIIGDGVIEGDNFPKYSESFSSNSDTPFNGLLTLAADDAGEVAKFCIPYTVVPGERSTDTYVFADFATNSYVLDSGRILNGDWEVKFQINRSTDNSAINADYRIEMFLVSGDGKVTERIFRSAIIEGVGLSGDGSVTYSTEIEIPMIISGSGTQLVMRLIAYPYSRDGNAVDVGALQAQMGDTPLGLRIESLSITKHTVSRLVISQTASFLGSPAFYEDLQLVPNQSIGQTSDFWFIASEFLTNTFVVNGNVGIDITGSLYSPAWFITMPSGMEVRARGQGFKDHDVWFRTVPASAAAAEPATTAAEDKVSKTTHVAYETTDDVEGNSVSMMASESVIRHKTFDAPYRTAIQSNNVAGKTGSGVQTLQGAAPNLQFITNGTFGNYSGVLALISQGEGNDYAYSRSHINHSLNGNGTWMNPHRNMDGADFNAVRKFTDGVQFPSFAQSPVSSLAYVTGWAEPGAILLKEANIFDSISSGSEGVVFLVDGVTNSEIPDKSPILTPTYISNLKANQTFAGIDIDNFNRPTIAYTLQGRSGEIFARTLNGGSGLSNPYVVATLRSKDNLASGVDIFSPTLAFHAETSTHYLAFWCSGKIFFTTFPNLVTSKGVIVNPIQLVAGDNDFSTGKNSANPVFASLVNSGGMINNQLGTKENDVPQQRVGLVASNKWPSQGNAFIYYKDANNKLMVRQVRIGGVTGAYKEV